MTTAIRVTAYAAGYCLAVTLSVSSAVLIFFKPSAVANWIAAGDLETLGEASELVAVAAGFHAVAFGLFLLAKGRVRPPTRWAAARVALFAGAAAWGGVIAVTLLTLWAAFGGRNGFDPLVLLWFATGPFCFAAGMAAGARLAATADAMS